MYWTITYTVRDDVTDPTYHMTTAHSYYEAFGVFASCALDEEVATCTVVAYYEDGKPVGDGKPVLSYCDE